MAGSAVVDPAGLSRPERALWTAFAGGRWVDLRSRDPARDDLGQAGSWGVRRMIRAEVLTALLLGASRPEPGQAPAIRLRGAQLGPVGVPGDAVLAGAGLTIDGDMECNGGCRIRGEINLRGARIGGLLSFEDAVLDVSGAAAHLSRLQAGELCLRTARPMTGPIRLEQAHVSVLDDDAAMWPPQIWLNGFTYGNIRHGSGRVPVRERIDWVSRGPFGYQPQPYEELADYYRRSGHDDDVRRVLLAKQRHRRGTLSRPGRVAGRLLDVTVGYGYRPWLAAVWLVLLLTAGTVMFAADRRTRCPAARFRPTARSPTPLTC